MIFKVCIIFVVFPLVFCTTNVPDATQLDKQVELSTAFYEVGSSTEFYNETEVELREAEARRGNSKNNFLVQSANKSLDFFFNNISWNRCGSPVGISLWQPNSGQQNIPSSLSKGDFLAGCSVLYRRGQTAGFYRQ